MAFLAKLFGKKKDNEPAEETLTEEEGLTPEEEAAAEAAEATLLQEDVIEEEAAVEELAEDPAAEEIVAEEPVVEEPAVEAPVEEVLVEDEHEEIEETATKKSFWGRLKSGLTKTRTALFAPVDNLLKAFTKVDEDLLEELEEILISADVGFTATEEIMDELRERIKDGRLKEKEQVMEALREIMTDMIGESEPLHLTTTPSVLLVIGVNGAGKTTSIGKISKRLRLQGKKVVVAAADTFRAAAIDQLAVWCERAKVDMVRQNEGSDPAAVVFDAIAAAKKKQADVLIIDTAGRLQNKKNLMNELAKIDRVIDRELPGAARETLLVLDATTGQNAVSQAKEFSNAAKITGITLNKLDGTAKGGIIVSIKRELGIPVKFIGVGEKIDDMQEFDAEDFVSALFGE
ncbi:MAG: signal recognition particle-docking protein FtsY [Clostridia bacterium]|nr:signal recognition particle-docking protein FtsY [Clostridia bacterium]